MLAKVCAKMTAIILLAAIIAVAWYFVWLRYVSPLAGCVACVVVGACLGHPFFHCEVAGMPLTLDRMLLVLVAGVYVWGRYRGTVEPKPLGPTDLLLLAFLAVVIVSGTLSGWQGSRSEPYIAIWRCVGGYLVPFAIYWMARQSPLGRNQISLVHATLVVLGTYLAVTGICEMTGQWWAVFPRYIADPNVGQHFGRRGRWLPPSATECT